MMEEPKKQSAPISYSELMERRFARDLKAAIRAWNEAGRPHKR